MLGELFRAKRPCTGLGGDAAYFGLAAMGDFALHDALLRRVAGVSDPRVVQFPRLVARGLHLRGTEPWMASFPPIGGGAAAVRGGGAPKPQTTSVKNADNGLLVAKWSAFWRDRSRSWCVVRT